MSESTIKLVSVNNLKCKVIAPASVLYEIHEEFSFLVKGYKWQPAYKAGRWDGRIRLFNLRSKEFFTELVPELEAWADTNGYDVCKRGLYRPESLYRKELAEQIYADSRYKTPHWYQASAIEHALTKMRSFVISPTGSGKSYILYVIARYLSAAGINVLINVPSTILAEQLYDDFRDYATGEWDAEAHVHTLHSGKDKNTDKPIVISTWQTCQHIEEKEWFERFQGYICDEAHGASAKVLTSIIDKMSHAEFRLGVTGTLDGTALHQMDMTARFGKIIEFTTSRDLQDEGVLAPLSIDCVHIRYPESDVQKVRNLEYKDEIDYIIGHEARNQILARIAMKNEGNTLMVFNFIERHGKKLKDILEKMCEEQGRPFYYMDGSVDIETRNQMRKEIAAGDNSVLLANSQLISVGVNIPNLKTLIFCHPFKAKIRTLQTIGRILRRADGKEGAKLIDIADDFSTKTRTGKSKPNRVFRHFLERLAIYRDQKFDYRIVKLDL